MSASVPRSSGRAPRSRARSGRAEVSDDRDEEVHALPRARRGQRRAGRLLPRRGRPARRQPVPRRPRAALPRLRPRVARVRRVGRRRAPGGHARLRAARLVPRRRAGAATAAPGRPQHGRHDRRRDGVPGAARSRQAGARRRRGPVAGGASDSGYLRHAAPGDRRGALRGSCARRGPPHGRRRPVGHRGAEGLLRRDAAAAGHGGQDPLPDPESPALPAAVSADRRDARALGRVRPADRAGLRGAVEGADTRRARADDRRRRPHAALGAARGVRRGRDPLPRVTITVFGAGAIGGITGAALARAAHDVVLVDKAADHVAAMNAGGLTVERRDGAETVAVRAITPEKLGPGLGLVLLAVKSQDTRAALEVLAPRLANDGAIVSMQKDRKSTRLNSSHGYISYAVFCLKKKKKQKKIAVSDFLKRSFTKQTIDPQMTRRDFTKLS